MAIRTAVFRACGLLVLLAFTGAGPAAAQSREAMMDECAWVAQGYFRDHTAKSDMQYNGQRVDGTHAVNGRIFLETRAADFACSYNRDGTRMVEFFADGRERNAYLPGGKTPGGSSAAGNGSMARVTGVASNDVLNVRSGPGTNYRAIGALSNGTRVRNLGCQDQSGARWCQIEMLTDMHERGWVNARYLDLGDAAVQPPARPPAAGGTSSVRVRFAAGTHSADMSGTLAPGESRRYILGARRGQDLQVRLFANGGRMSYQIFNPDRSFLQNQVPPEQTYRGQLWQSGDHVIEVINRGNRSQSYSINVHIN